MRRGQRFLLIAATVALTVPSIANPARAYVQATSDEGYPLFWSTSCETVTIYLNGFTQMTPDAVAKSIAAAAHTWGPDAVTCRAATGDGGDGNPYFEIITALSMGGAVPGVADDGIHAIIFETDGSKWDETYYGAIAVTSRFREPSGKIVDADIEINAGDPYVVWSNLDPGAPPPANGIIPTDLQAVMTHEFGHFLGLAHTCLSEAGQGSDQEMYQPTIDDQGQMLPPCTDPPSSLNAIAAQSVMWYQINPGDASKRVLAPDDVRGVCAIYPPARDPHSCAANLPDDGCGCAAGPAGRSSLPGIALVALGLAGARRRRRRRRSR